MEEQARRRVWRKEKKRSKVRVMMNRKMGLKDGKNVEMMKKRG